jgi:hypothetical protein
MIGDRVNDHSKYDGKSGNRKGSEIPNPNATQALRGHYMSNVTGPLFGSARAAVLE